MKIRSLEIRNFRGISNLVMDDLQDMVVIAGPNGCGKSCVLDAIRLLKSIYGGYQPNEIHQWLSEFQLNFAHDPDAFPSIKQDRTKELIISATFELQQDERIYLLENAEKLVTESVWRSSIAELQGWGTMAAAPLAAQARVDSEEIEKRAADLTAELLTELSADNLKGSFVLPVDGGMRTLKCRALQIVFSLYTPSVIGVIEYHGPKRHYEREAIQGVNLNLDAAQIQQRGHSALYNHGAKYSNVKGEMASLYVRDALAFRAGVVSDENRSLTSTLKELFTQFFPDKEFLGPAATSEGLLRFPVRTQTGAEHDLNELSSGEKEILFGYLRLRNSAPKNSIILFDEPELHLNPRLLRGLPEFYRKHLGTSLNNQLWLVTHSDALLRESVGSDMFSVFHMSPATNFNVNQAKRIEMEVELERAIIDLVGDLASYKPGAKLLILEGADSEFDRKMIATLFPKFSSEVNAISGGNKSGVHRLRVAMEEAVRAGNIPVKVFSITDADLDVAESVPGDFSWQWDVYHIENYLIEPEIIRKVLVDLKPGEAVPDADFIYDELQQAASECVGGLVRHVLQTDANQMLVKSINTSIDPNKPAIAESLYSVLNASRSRIEKAFDTSLSIESLRDKESEVTERFRVSLSNGKWQQQHRGRDILRRFAGKHARDVKYEIFRNLVLAKMALAGYQPSGMKKILDAVQAA